MHIRYNNDERCRNYIRQGRENIIMSRYQKWILITVLIGLLIPQFATRTVVASGSTGKSSTKSANTTRSEKAEKVIYLTFDDGPTAHTMQLLDILAKYDAKATFFMLGPHMEQYQTATKRIVKEGNGLGLHGVTHVVKQFYSSPFSAYKEMRDANESLYQVAGVRTSLVRTPYGSKPYMKQGYRDVMLNQGGFHLWDWNVDSLDWKYKKDHQRVYKNIMSQVNSVEKRGTAPVVLMHDQPATLKVLPLVLETLKKDGYTFKVLNKQNHPVNFWNDER